MHNTTNKRTLIKPLKSMGQNFLTDSNIARKIVRLSGINQSHGVLEVGPGFGLLTCSLAEAAGHVTAVELDSRLLPELQSALGGFSNVTIVQGDILKTDIRKLLSETLPEPCRRVCANLPYNITTPAITHLMDSGVFESLTVMVQKEVAVRICAPPGTPDYSAFTVYVNYSARPQILMDVPAQCFTPHPTVISSVVKIDMRKERLLEGEKERFFNKVVRASFSQRRKTLVNALYALLRNTHTKDDILEAVLCCGIDADIRGERLSMEEFTRLSLLLYNEHFTL